MHTVFTDICKALDTISAAVIAGWTDDRTLNEVFGWNQVALTRHDLAKLATVLSSKIKEADPEAVDRITLLELQKIAPRLTVLQASTIPQLYNGGNAVYAAPVFIATMSWVHETLASFIGKGEVLDPKAAPFQLSKRVRAMQMEVDRLVIDKAKLEAQIALIDEAHSVAEALPANLQRLEEASEKVERIGGKTQELLANIETRSAEASVFTSDLQGQRDEAVRLISQCEEAYRATTTKGLAAAFDQRANRLTLSMWVWVAGLIAALAVGSLIGTIRISQLTLALSGPTPHWAAVWLQAAMSVLSVGAPLWFAWVATKQLGQRFRLAEDYGFKASVAKAYEGYRREAARIDVEFEARLFASALSRLEEAPLRLVESDTHGSPWHEFTSSAVIRQAINSIPEFPEKVLALARAGISGSAVKDKSVSG